MTYFVYKIFATYRESQNEIGMAAPKSIPTRRVETTICTVYICSYIICAIPTSFLVIEMVHVFQSEDVGKYTVRCTYILYSIPHSPNSHSYDPRLSHCITDMHTSKGRTISLPRKLECYTHRQHTPLLDSLHDAIFIHTHCATATSPTVQSRSRKILTCGADLAFHQVTHNHVYVHV